MIWGEMLGLAAKTENEGLSGTSQTLDSIEVVALLALEPVPGRVDAAIS